MRTIDQVIDNYENSGCNEIEQAYEYNQVEEMLREYALYIIDECARVCITDDAIREDILEVKNRIM